MTNKTYLVFGFVNDQVDSMFGTTETLPQLMDDRHLEHEVVKLPHAFMLGNSFDALVLRSAAGKRVLAWIPIGSRPLAL